MKCQLSPSKGKTGEKEQAASSWRGSRLSNSLPAIQASAWSILANRLSRKEAYLTKNEGCVLKGHSWEIPMGITMGRAGVLAVMGMGHRHAGDKGMQQHPSPFKQLSAGQERKSLHKGAVPCRAHQATLPLICQLV